MAILVDTSALLAYAFRRDANHRRASDFFRQLIDEPRLVPVPILTELFYMTTVRINYARAVQVFATTQAAFQIESLTEHDMTRMQDIMTRYTDAELDFADTSIMAIAERLNITRICTFDRRDFSLVKPNHCNYFDLLP
jgi:hypothetical protein